MLQRISQGAPEQWTGTSSQTPIAGAATHPPLDAKPVAKWWARPTTGQAPVQTLTREFFGAPADGQGGAIVDSLCRENHELQQEVAALERELDELQTSFASQELGVLRGYLVSVRPGIGVAFAAWCPKLRAVAQGDTRDDAVADLERAMDLFLAHKRAAGQDVPAKDVEA